MTDTKYVAGADKLLQRIRNARNTAIGIVADREIAELLAKRMRKRFEQQIDPDDNPWPALSEATVKRKQRKGYKNPKAALQATGRLLGALKVIQGSNAGLLGNNTGASMRIGVADPVAAQYGRIHNYGYGVEQRRFIGIGNKDVRAVRDLIRRKMKSIAK